MRLLFIFLIISFLSFFSIQGAILFQSEINDNMITFDSQLSKETQESEKQPLILGYKISYANPGLDDKTWKRIEPHLLPANHSLKKKLDSIFENTRVTESLETLKKAGFKTKGPRAWSQTIIATHNSLKDYIIKLFTDSQTGVNEVSKLLERVEGAKLAQNIIDKYKLEKYLKVPKKYLYPIPSVPPSNPDLRNKAKRFLIIEDKFEIFSKYKNYKMWKSDDMTNEMLDAIFILLSKGKFYDLIYPFNLPFARDKKIAIIDTEHFGNNVYYHKLDKYMNSRALNHWQLLIKKGGPTKK